MMAALERHPVVTQITQHLTTRLSEWFGATAILAQPVVNVRKWSFMMRYEVARKDGPQTAVLVKIPREPGLDTLESAVKAEQWYAATQAEYDSLEAIATTFSQGSSNLFCPIRPLAYLSEWNALVMEELSARPLKEIMLQKETLLRFEKESYTIEAALNRAGAWLSIFHEALGNPVFQPFDSAELRADVEQELAALHRLTDGKVDTRSIEVAFEQALAALPRTQVPFVDLHGDFNCANILVAPDGRVSALDMNNNARGPIYYDLATLITDLFTRKAMWLFYGFSGRMHFLKRGANLVLEGYFGSEPYEQQILDVICSLMVVRKWVRDEEARVESRPILRHLQYPLQAVARRHFRSLIGRYLTSAQKVTVAFESLVAR